MIKLNDLYNEYLRKQDEINRSEPVIESDDVIEILTRAGEIKEQQHAELTAWYRNERQAITGLTWEQEQSEYDARLANSRYSEEN